MTLLTTSAAIAAAALALAYGAGQFASRSIATEIVIDAPVGAVWAGLTDTEAYPGWNPFVTRIEGDLRPGAQLAVTISLPGRSPMDFAPDVLVAAEDSELRWIGRLGVPGIFDGEHHWMLEDTGDGRTRLRHGETFRGMLVPVLFGMLEDSTRAGFEAMNAALRDRAEDRA